MFRPMLHAVTKFSCAEDVKMSYNVCCIQIYRVTLLHLLYCIDYYNIFAEV